MCCAWAGVLLRHTLLHRGQLKRRETRTDVPVEAPGEAHIVSAHRRVRAGVVVVVVAVVAAVVVVVMVGEGGYTQSQCLGETSSLLSWGKS